MQERRNSSALAMELRLPCFNPSIFPWDKPLMCVFDMIGTYVVVEKIWKITTRFWSDSTPLFIMLWRRKKARHKQAWALQWRHDERDSVSNHRHLYCFLNRLFRRRSKKTSMLPVTVLRKGNSPVTGEFRAQKAHDDVTKWKPLSRYWPFVREIHRSPVNSPHKGQWRGALALSLICAWINCWANHSCGWWMRRHCSHHDATAMSNGENIWWRHHVSTMYLPNHFLKDQRVK